MKHSSIFYLTDFGLSDTFAGVMKAVVLGLGHEGAQIDLTHGIAPQDVLAGAMALEDTWPWLPSGSVVVAVVDPGVGTPRRALALHLDGRYVVAPDNGLLTPLLAKDAQVRHIQKGGAIQPDRSATFHGRDVFAPAAALLATRQRKFEDLGPEVNGPVLLELPAPQISPKGRTIILKVLTVDRFGNAVLNHSLRDARSLPLERGEFHCSAGSLGPLRRTYGDVPVGTPVVYWNSAGRLEVAINGGHAAHQLQLGVGATIHFKVSSAR
ncbi:hypothetical protein GC173_16005 [bacterium]|nr:hypothetical protein [bacterium]